MIFLLATLPVAEYSVLQKICKSSNKADCKGSNFRGLRSLDNQTVSSLLNEVANESLPLQSLNNKCKEIKALSLLKKKFTELVGENTWIEAQEKYPEFAVVKTKFLCSNSAQLLQDYCRKALRYVEWRK